MAGGSNGYRAARLRRQLAPGLISSTPGTAGLPRFISFSTSYPETVHREQNENYTKLVHGIWTGRSRFCKVIPVCSFYIVRDRQLWTCATEDLTRGQRAIACNGLREPWQLWEPRQSEICNLHTAPARGSPCWENVSQLFERSTIEANVATLGLGAGTDRNPISGKLCG